MRKARIGDAEAIRDLIQVYSDRKLLLPRPLGKVYDHLRDFFVYELNGTVKACCALQIIWENLAEVRSLAVADDSQGRGVGSALVEACLKEARAMAITRVFTLTYRPSLFERLGFRQVPKGSLPHKIWTDCVNCPEFPNCKEIALVIDLPVSSRPESSSENGDPKSG